MIDSIALEKEVAELIVGCLNLEAVRAEDIDPEAPLFGIGQDQGLGLDPIDALELVRTISTKYGFLLHLDDAADAAVFASLRSLSEYIAYHRRH